MTRVSVAFLSLAMLGGCASSPVASELIGNASPEESTPQTASAEPSASSAPGPTDGDGGFGQIRLQVDGGDWAGSWTGQITSGGCSRNLIAGDNPILPTFAPNSFSAGAAEVAGIPDFGTFLFEIYDAQDAAVGTDQFHFGVLSEDLATTLLLDPPDGAGDGMATLDDRGATATIHAEGVFADESSGSIDIECYEVVDG